MPEQKLFPLNSVLIAETVTSKGLRISLRQGSVIEKSSHHLIHEFSFGFSSDENIVVREVSKSRAPLILLLFPVLCRAFDEFSPYMMEREFEELEALFSLIQEVTPSEQEKFLQLAETYEGIVAGISLMFHLQGVSVNESKNEKLSIAHVKEFEKENFFYPSTASRFLDPVRMVEGQTHYCFVQSFKNPVALKLAHALYATLIINDSINLQKVLGEIELPSLIDLPWRNDIFVQIKRISYDLGEEFWAFVLGLKVIDAHRLIGRVTNIRNLNEAFALSETVIRFGLPVKPSITNQLRFAHEAYNAIFEKTVEADNANIISEINRLLMDNKFYPNAVKLIRDFVEESAFEGIRQSFDFLVDLKRIISTLTQSSKKWITTDRKSDIIIELLMLHKSPADAVDLIMRVAESSSQFSLQQWLKIVNEPEVFDNSPLDWWNDIL